jgi:glutamyl-tRNA synthetase
MENTNTSGTKGKVRTRFAPSPTGYLHVGGVRTALFAWLVARQAGGKFILRIEDTDKNREVGDSEQHIMESLKWLKLNWDEGPDINAEYGPYRQSERLQVYKDVAQRLIEAGHAYTDPYTPEELDKFREKAKAEKRPFLFRDHRPSKSPKWDGTTALRFRSEPKPYNWHDAVMGDLSSGPEAIDDFILMKSDGYPTYNFAHILDDHFMEISHVIRSQEFLPSVPKFLNLYEALEIPVPVLATVPYVMGPDGKKKLSKRDLAKDILDYRSDGYLPEALLNFMATLGWNDGTEQEIFSMSELITKFSLDKVQRSGASFDENRLTWMNGLYIRQLSVEELFGRIEDSPQNFWDDGQAAERDKKLQVLGLVQERLKYLAELPNLTHFFFRMPATTDVRELLLNPVDKGLKDIDVSQKKSYLLAALKTLEGADFNRDEIQVKLNSLLEQLQTKPSVLFPLIRIAVTGSKSSPEIFGTLEVIGKDESLHRLRLAAGELD